ncbi:MAG: anhydro-N-acetylmuramic acid kinase [Flavobacteriaceae bacterium]|nr:anhydro-N-acetylmuramic acid kinase [Flavobacteriaceae bacterium]
MKTKSWYCIGLMSGTSLDGLDLVYVSFNLDKKYAFKIKYSETIPYSKKWIKLLKSGFYFNKAQLQKLDFKYGNYLAASILEFIEKNKIKKIDFIASHGHTIHHKPAANYTLQIGNGQVIANKTNLKTICDFRTQDVALGGQGAPLVPIGDKLLFAAYTYCLNLGGFANLSFDKNKERIAFDICPVNIVLNHYVNKLGFDYDEGGKIAANGKINQNLLNDLNGLAFYKSEKPKSLGFEFVTEIIFPLINEYNLIEKDILRTFVEHVAFQISKKIQSNQKLLITGGGTFNFFLINRIKYFSKNEIVIPNKTIIDFKEALIFAFLGLRKLEHKINCLQSVTGSCKDHSSGVVFLPSKN